MRNFSEKFHQNKKKGQFYIIGALLLILFMFSSRYSGVVSVDEPADTASNLFANLKTEYQKAVDSSYAATQSSQAVESDSVSVLGFFENVSISHGQRLEALALAFVPDGNDYNVSVFNYLRESATINLTLGAETQTTTLAHGASARLVFGGVARFVGASVRYATSSSKTEMFNITNRKLGTYLDIKLKTQKTTWSDVVTSWEKIA